MFHRGQAHPREVGRIDVVETAQAVIFRHPCAAFQDGVQHAVGHHVVDGHEGRDVPLGHAAPGQGVTGAVLDVQVAALLLGRDGAGADEEAALGAGLAEHVAQPFQAPQPCGIVLVQRRGDAGDGTVPQPDKVAGHQHARIIVVELHRIQIEAGVPVADDHHGRLPVGQLCLGRAQRHGAKDDAPYGSGRQGAQQAGLHSGVAVGGEDHGVVVMPGGGILHGLHQGRVIGVDHIGAEDGHALLGHEVRGPVPPDASVAESLGGLAHLEDRLAREGDVRPFRKDHGGRGRGDAAAGGDVCQSDALAALHGHLPALQIKNVAVKFNF